MNSYQIELYGQSIEFTAPRVLANAIHNKFKLIEKEWHGKISSNFYSIFENLDDLYENAEKIAQEALLDSIGIAMEILAENLIYDIDEQVFINEHLRGRDFWDRHFEAISSEYESIMYETAQKDVYRTQRRLNRSKLIGFGPPPSSENGYRSAQSYANFSNAVDNIGHGIFNMMAKGVTAIGNSIRKDEIFKSRKTVDAIDSAVCSIIVATNRLLKYSPASEPVQRL